MRRRSKSTDRLVPLRLSPAAGELTSNEYSMKTKKIMKALRRFWNRITGNWWRPARCEFPYPRGYATYNAGTRTVLDTGLTRDEAQAICDQLNS